MAEFADDESSRNLESRFFQSNISRSESITNDLRVIDEQEKELGPWKKYLEGTPEADNLAIIDGLFDIPGYETINEDCENIIDFLDIPEDQEPIILSTLKIIISVYIKSEGKSYRIENGWVPLLSQLILTNPKTRLATYISFKEIRNCYVPEVRTHGFVLRLLLLYHDPELCHLFDVDKISLEKATERWVNRLFAGICSQSVCKSLWKFIFGSHDSYMLFFVILAIISNHRDDIMAMKFADQKKIENAIQLFPRLTNTRNVQDLIESAKKYNANTPPFFKELFKPFMFGKEREKKPNNLPKYLPTSANHLKENINALPSFVSFYYFIADCRTLKLYDAGRFNTKYQLHIDCKLLIQSPHYLTAVKREFFSKLKKYQTEEPESKPKHICLMGSGLENDDNCVEAVAESLLKDQTKYVSILHGGYKMIHTLLKLKNEIIYYLAKHDDNKCGFCHPKLLSLNDYNSEDEDDDIRLENVEVERTKTPVTEISFKDRLKQRLTRTGQGIRKQLSACINSSDPICKKKSRSVGENISLDNIYDNIYEEIDPIYGNESIGATSSDIYGVFDSKSATSSRMDSSKSDLEYKSVFKGKRLEQLDKTVEFDCLQVKPGRYHKSKIIVTDQGIKILRIHESSEVREIMNCRFTDIIQLAYNKKKKTITISCRVVDKDNSVSKKIVKCIVSDLAGLIKILKQRLKKVSKHYLVQE